jgi:hypothetical protein
VSWKLWGVMEQKLISNEISFFAHCSNWFLEMFTLIVVDSLETANSHISLKIRLHSTLQVHIIG